MTPPASPWWRAARPYVWGLLAPTLLFAFHIATGFVWGWPRWDVLVAIPLYVFIGYQAARTVRTWKHIDDPLPVLVVGCRACGWRETVPGPDAIRPAMHHHVEFECTSDEAAAFRELTARKEEDR